MFKKSVKSMKKISLLCAVALAGLSLGGCGNGHHYNLQKLRAEHSRLLKQTKNKNNHKHNKKHSAKSKKSTKQSASSKHSSTDNSKNNSANDQHSHQSTQTQTPENNHQGQHQSNNDQHADQVLWSDTNNENNWKGSMYEHLSPQERYDYIYSNAQRWSSTNGEAGNANYSTNNQQQ